MPFEGIERVPQEKSAPMLEIKTPDLEAKKAEHRALAQKFLAKFQEMEQMLQALETQDPDTALQGYDKASSFLSDNYMRMGALQDGYLRNKQTKN